MVFNTLQSCGHYTILAPEYVFISLMATFEIINSLGPLQELEVARVITSQFDTLTSG